MFQIRADSERSADPMICRAISVMIKPHQKRAFIDSSRLPSQRETRKPRPRAPATAQTLSVSPAS